MLQGIHRVGQSWVGKLVVGVLFAFLILSFAIWGIGDIFRGNVRTQVASVGGTEIGAEAFRTAYQNEYQALLQRTRQSITPDQARALGLEQRILGRMISEAALDREVRTLGLSVSDDLVVRAIQNDPTFQGANGAFDRNRFFDLLRQNNMTEPQFVREQRSLVARNQLGEALAGAVPVPLAMREAIHRYQTERRAAEYVTLPASAAGEIPDPTDAQIETFYDGRRNAYRAPEYRALSVLIVDPNSLAKPDAVSDADARAFYETTKDTRFGRPERRTVQQIVFPTEAEAEAAAAAIAAGGTFDAVAAERNIDAATLTLGTFSRAEMIDPAAAETAFGLAPGAVSAPVAGRFGPALLRVTAVEGGTVRPFAEVETEVKRELALTRARDGLQAVHDAIEDQRSGAKPLAAIASERGLPLVTVPAVDRQGQDKAGQPTAAARVGGLVQAAYRSDVGADNEALRTPGDGWAWFEVTGVEPARDRPLAEVRERAVADWKADERSRLLLERARALVGRVNAGEAMSAAAAETGQPLGNAADLDRNGTAGGLSAAIAARIFATPVGRAADAAAADGGRVVFKVTGATVPPFVTTTQESAGIETQLRGLVSDDLLQGYVGQLQKDAGVQVYGENVRRAIGGES